MKPPPATTFEVPQAEFLFELFIVAFDDPAVLGGANQIGKFRFGRQSGKPILGWFLVGLGPFDEQPLLRMWLGSPVIPVGRMNAESRKARSERPVGSLPPHHAFPSRGGKRHRHLLDRLWGMLLIPL